VDPRERSEALESRKHPRYRELAADRRERPRV